MYSQFPGQFHLKWYHRSAVPRPHPSLYHTHTYNLNSLHLFHSNLKNFNILSPCGHVLQTYCILLTSAHFSIFHYSKLTCICFLSDKNLIEQHMVFPNIAMFSKFHVLFWFIPCTNHCIVNPHFL